METILYFIRATALVATSKISWATYQHALEKRPPAVGGLKGSYSIGKV